MKWPLALRSSLEKEQRESRRLRSRLFVLRDVMKQAKGRARMNFHLADNHAAYCLLDQALIRDLDAETAAGRP